MKETTAMQIGRDDYKAYRASLQTPESRWSLQCNPFPQGSKGAAEWLEGWNREEMRNPQSKAYRSDFQKVKQIMEN